MKVRDIMETKVITLSPNTTYEEAAGVLYGNNISGAPVVDENNQIVGMISEKDLFKVLYPFYKSFYEHPEFYADIESRESKAKEIRGKKIGIFMSKEIATVTPDTPILTAGAVMLARGIHRLPVMEEGKLVGIISRKSIYRAILKENFGL